jgi:hypothetical protein
MGSPFVFATDPALYVTSDCRVIQIPDRASNTRAFLGNLATCLDLPGYFGENWDALDECLRDFHWVKEHRIVLWHDALPELPENDLRVYLDVLAYAVNDWRSGEEHELIVLFHPRMEALVEQLCPNEP